MGNSESSTAEDYMDQVFDSMEFGGTSVQLLYAKGAFIGEQPIVQQAIAMTVLGEMFGEGGETGTPAQSLNSVARRTARSLEHQYGGVWNVVIVESMPDGGGGLKLSADDLVVYRVGGRYAVVVFRVGGVLVTPAPIHFHSAT